MKYIYILCLLVLGGMTSLHAQQLNNGRSSNTPPAIPQAEKTPAITETFTGSDEDVPGSKRDVTLKANETDTYYPTDVDILTEELNAYASPKQVTDKVNNLQAQVALLVAATEDLRRENRMLRRSLNGCCDGSMGLTAKDAYLTQNAPNPYQGITTIGYFIPEGLNNATLEIRDLKGVLLESVNISGDGLGSVEIQGAYPAGAYLYYLSIDEQLVDSKVMVVK